VSNDERDALKRYWEAIAPPPDTLTHVRERLLREVAPPAPPKAHWLRSYGWLSGVAFLAAVTAWSARGVDRSPADTVGIAPVTPSIEAHEPEAPPPAPTVASLPSVNVRDLPSAPATGTSRAAPGPSRGGATTTTTTAPSAMASAPTLADELAMIDRARAALGDGDGLRALSIVDDYELRWARPRFAEEAAAIRVEALAVQGSVERARAARDAFRARWPNSTYVPRLERLSLP